MTAPARASAPLQRRGRAGRDDHRPATGRVRHASRRAGRAVQPRPGAADPATDATAAAKAPVQPRPGGRARPGALDPATDASDAAPPSARGQVRGGRICPPRVCGSKKSGPGCVDSKTAGAWFCTAAAERSEFAPPGCVDRKNRPQGVWIQKSGRPTRIPTAARRFAETPGGAARPTPAERMRPNCPAQTETRRVKPHPARRLRHFRIGGCRPARPKADRQAIDRPAWPAKSIHHRPPGRAGRIEGSTMGNAQRMASTMPGENSPRLPMCADSVCCIWSGPSRRCRSRP